MKRAPRKPAREAALDIVRTLRAAGHEALFAGGCVRDMLLGEKPKDYDVATDAPPDRVLAFFPRGRRVGAKFGVILVRRFGHDVEVATFRTDGSYTDGRRPDSVTFGTALEDASRRDFTINGMFYDPLEDRIIDYVQGQADLATGRLRTIGDPQRRFEEDHLRMLRALRFAARLGFSIDPATLDAIRDHAARLREISAERIWMELEQMLAGPSRALAWRLALESGLRPHLAPSWAADERQDPAGLARLEALPTTGPGDMDPSAGMACLLLEAPPQYIEAIARELTLSNAQRKNVLWLVARLTELRERQDPELADLKTMMAHPAWPLLLPLAAADETVRTGATVGHDALAARAAAVAPEDVSPPPLIAGEDLLAMGFEQGPRFGRVLEALYRAQLNEEVRTREQALQRLEKLQHGAK